MNIYICTFNDQEDGLQIPIIVQAQDAEEAERNIIKAYFWRYCDPEFDDLNKMLEQGYKSLEEEGIGEFFVFNPVTRELIYHLTNCDDIEETWKGYIENHYNY